jgi:hypothetical protein
MLPAQPLSITADQVPFRTVLEAELDSVLAQLGHLDARWTREQARYDRDRMKLERTADELRRRIDLEG